MPPSLIFTLYEKLQESPPAVAGVVICEVRLVVFDLFALSYLCVNSPKRWTDISVLFTRSVEKRGLYECI